MCVSRAREPGRAAGFQRSLPTAHFQKHNILGRIEERLLCFSASACHFEQKDKEHQDETGVYTIGCTRERSIARTDRCALTGEVASLRAYSLGSRACIS